MQGKFEKRLNLPVVVLCWCVTSTQSRRRVDLLVSGNSQLVATILMRIGSMAVVNLSSPVCLWPYHFMSSSVFMSCLLFCSLFFCSRVREDSSTTPARISQVAHRA